MGDTARVSERFEQLIRALVWLSVTVVGLNLTQVATTVVATHFGLALEQQKQMYLLPMALMLFYSGVSVFRVGDRLLSVVYSAAILLFVGIRLLEATGTVARFPAVFDDVIDSIVLLLLGLFFARGTKLLMDTYQERHDVLLENLAYGTSHRVGEDFLSGLVESIADTPRVNVAFVSEADTASRTDTIISCAVAGGGQPPDRLTPGQSFRWDHERFADSFSGQASLRIQLTDRDGVTIGHLILVHEAGEISSRQQSSLQIFASRASAEIQRIKADRKSEEMEARMFQVQKLESLGVLAGGIAHDFNNLLQAIQGYTTIATDTLPEGSESYETIRRIDPIIDQGAAMCDRLLAYAGRSVRRDAVCQLNQLVAEAVDIVRSGRPDCSVVLEQADDPLCVWGDSAQLSQVQSIC